MKRPFKSFLAPFFEEFILSRKAAGSWCTTYYENLHYFDNYIVDNFPTEDRLTNQMTLWCSPRSTENGNSCRVRTTVIWNFLDYARKRQWTDLESTRNPTIVPCSYVPHYFTPKELSRFFNVCDRYYMDLALQRRSLRERLNRLELPVFFRLLLSSGMRTCEARWLKRRNVNLEDGVIEIEKSKGANQHRIALHESMLSILISYEKAMSELMPEREHFFPNVRDNIRSSSWVCYHFMNVWCKCNKGIARAYDLRSHYAVTNITKWENHGYELSGKLLFLSRSMGHKNIQSTYGYFHLTPMLADKLKRNTEINFNNIIPQFTNYENEE